jgi:hypothetical protein
MTGVLLQKQAEAVQSFLLQWLSGYAFLFNGGVTVPRQGDKSGNLRTGCTLGIRQLGVPTDAESRYAWEKHMMKEGSLSPLMAVPDFAAADARVSNGPPSAWRNWNLADLWLDRSAALSNCHTGASKMRAGTEP